MWTWITARAAGSPPSTSWSGAAGAWPPSQGRWPSPRARSGWGGFAHGHPCVPVSEGGFTVDSGMVAMTTLLAEHPDLDGLFTGNDLMAQGAVQVLRDHGRRVPQDVAVVGFDDSSIAVTCRPRLTTVRQPVEEMAAPMAMARLLDEHILGGRTDPTSVVFAPELVIRDSA